MASTPFARHYQNDVFRAGTSVNSGDSHECEVKHAQNTGEIAEHVWKLLSDRRVTGLPAYDGGFSISGPLLRQFPTDGLAGVLRFGEGGGEVTRQGAPRG